MSVTDTVLRIRADDTTGAVFASVASNNQRMARSIQSAFSQITQAATQFGNETQRSGRQAESALSGTNIALATMATRYLGVAAAVATAKTAFSNFAQLDTQLRVIAQQTGKTLEEISKLKPTFESWATSAGRNMDEVVEAFNTFRRRSRTSIEETVAAFPALKDAAVVMQVNMTELANAVGTMFHTYKIGSGDAERALGALVYAQQKYNLDTGELLRWGPQLTEMLSTYGSTGVTGIKNLVAYLAVLDTAYGNTQRSTRALAEVVTTGFDFAPLGQRLSMTVEDMRNVMELQVNAGRSAMDVFLEWVDEAFKRGMKISEFPRQIQPAITALLRNQKEIKELSEATGEGVERMRRGVESFSTSPGMAVHRLLVQFNEALEDFGGILDSLGATTGLEKLSSTLKDVRRTIEEIKSLGLETVLRKSLEERQKAGTATRPDIYNLPFVKIPYPTKTPGQALEEVQKQTHSQNTRGTNEEDKAAAEALRQAVPQEPYLGGPTGVPLPRPRPPGTGPGLIERWKGLFKSSGIEADIQPASFTGEYTQARQLDEQRDTNGTLTEIRDILRRAYPEAGPGGAAIGGGGGVTGGGGGGGVGIGGGIGTLGDRQNNPGNIKWGEFAKTHGATGPGAGGHAIFPDYQTGRLALESLLRGKGAGQSIAEIGRWYAQDPGWAAGVASSMGVDPSYRPGSAEVARLADAIQRQEGTAVGGFAGGGGGGAPDAILKQAQIVAMSGDPGAVQAFMASQGYPKSGPWCGEFVAAVVKSTGGTPPRNAGTASSWRNWGYPTNSPQPGDIAVRKGSRFGGYAPTGYPGSHVTIFGGAAGQGAFTGLGGNQRRWAQQYPMSAYDFRSALAPSAAYAENFPPGSEEYKSGKAQPVPSDDELNALISLFNPHSDPLSQTSRGYNMYKRFKSYLRPDVLPSEPPPVTPPSKYRPNMFSDNADQFLRWLDEKMGAQGKFYTPPSGEGKLRVPVEFVYPPGDAQFRRASIRREVDREMREGRLTSMLDIGSA